MDTGVQTNADLSEIQRIQWDWIVVGTGVGGATFGHTLAEAGRRVLFIEKGLDRRTNPQKKSGQFLESLVSNLRARSVEDHQNTGRSSSSIWDATRNRWIKPILGSGTGGSSALFGMVMERFWKEDFEPGRWHKGAGASLPERWPVSFKEMEPFYKEAEQLFGVSGSVTDPLRSDQEFLYAPRPPLSDEGTHLMSTLTKKGLHPYALPLARQWGTPCRFCQSHLCQHDCKNDAAKICLEPAIRLWGASLLTEAEVLEVTGRGAKVSGVTVLVKGKIRHLSAHNVALAAGALQTPLILLKSRSPFWPQGLANRSGMVGRNLMRHYIDLIGIPSLFPRDERGDQKEIGVNDFYFPNGEKLGTLADFGRMPPIPVVLEDLDNDVASSGRIFGGMIWQTIRPLVGWFLKQLFDRTRFLALIVEDLPDKDNRVEAGTHGADITIHYKIRAAELSRIHRARSLVRGVLGPLSTFLLPNAENTKLLAHACGTCRMGNDPHTSVVDRHNRAHGISNLYIVDSSFFPSSGGVNPALTIAANALRVARHLTQKIPLTDHFRPQGPNYSVQPRIDGGPVPDGESRLNETDDRAHTLPEPDTLRVPTNKPLRVPQSTPGKRILGGT